MDERTIGKLQVCLQVIDEQDTTLTRVGEEGVWPETIGSIQDKLAVVYETLARIIEEASNAE